jgi:hypothetical protein
MCGQPQRDDVDASHATSRVSRLQTVSRLRRRLSPIGRYHELRSIGKLFGPFIKQYVRLGPFGPSV